MPQTNTELLRKFETIRRWMVEDTERALFDARANFLVAQGLLNYTETVGSFITGKEGPAGVNFDTFFRRLGPEYDALLKRHNKKRKMKPHVVYDDLRCGLAHEYVVKRKSFTIWNSADHTPEPVINSLTIIVNGIPTTVEAGITYSKDSRGKGTWHIVCPKYWLDFKHALEEYWRGINDIGSKDLRKKFFKRARGINLKNFNV